MLSHESGTVGQFVAKKSSVRPAIRVEEMDWGADDASVIWTPGQFVKRPGLRPVMKLEWSETPTLELLVQPDPAADAVQLALGLYDLMNAVNKLDLALGGTGLTTTDGSRTNGTVTITLAAQQQPGAADRLRQICEQINREKETAAQWFTAVVKTIGARHIA